MPPVFHILQAPTTHFASQTRENAFVLVQRSRVNGNHSILAATSTKEKKSNSSGRVMCPAVRVSHGSSVVSFKDAFCNFISFQELKFNTRNGRVCRNAVVICSHVSEVELQELQAAKNNLLQTVLNKNRGLKASSHERAAIEEIMVDVERFNAGVSLDLNLLNGTWLLQYTTAPDVISILQAAELPFLEVGQIFQKFSCTDGSDRGTVFNIVRWSIPGVLQDVEGATLLVTADFSVVSSRNIQLQFREAKVGEIRIDEGVEALIAPAFLPRTFFALQVLQFFRSLDIRVPLSTNETPRAHNRSSVGLLYYLTFVDRDMLIGRALGNGGEFIFSRTQNLNT